MGLNLYRRHRRDCKASHPEEHLSSEFDERKKGWKRCECPIFSSGTLARRYRRQSTGKWEWDDARAVALIGPDHLGIVPDEGFEAWDAVDFETARGIAAVLGDVRLVVASLASEADNGAPTCARTKLRSITSCACATR